MELRGTISPFSDRTPMGCRSPVSPNPRVKLNSSRLVVAIGVERNFRLVRLRPAGRSFSKRAGVYIKTFPVSCLKMKVRSSPQRGSSGSVIM